MANMKTVVITGAAGGMGSASADLFKSKGYQVLGTDRQEIEGVDFQVVGDVADEVTWQKISKVIEQNGLEVSSLINIAGRNYFDLITEAKKSEWLNMFEVNVVAMVLGIKHISPFLRQSKDATIVNMSSISAHIGSVGYAAYVATKGAVDSLTKSLALELAPKIRVNAVAPGLVIPTDAYLPGQMEALRQAMPLGRLPEPEDVADAVLWLAKAEVVTGQTIFVDGGAALKSFDRDFLFMGKNG